METLKGKGERNSSIDFCKGVLILFVVLGHVILGGLRENVVRYVIYGFHMATFFGISGYMFREEKVRQMKFNDLVKKYFYRIILPWMVAVNLYYVLNHFDNIGSINIRAYLLAWIYPYYHLWYVPTYMIYIFSTWIVFKIFNKSTFKKYIILITLSFVIPLILKKIPTIICGIDVKVIIGLVGEIWQGYYLFFLIGLLMQRMVKYCNSNIAKILVGCTIISVIVRIWLFGHTNQIVSSINRYFFGVGIVILVCYICHEKLIKGCKIIEWCGRNSYAIYLWHIVGKMWTIRIVGMGEEYKYYLTNIFFFMVLCGGFYIGNKVKYLRMIYGGVR